MTDLYTWIKALHVISIIAWMAGMLYLPRLFVYHSGLKPGSEASELFKIMELRLQRIIILPAMIATFVFGLWLIYLMGFTTFKAQGWLHAKLLLVLGMSAFHGALVRWRRDFANDANRHSESFYRKINEIPTILMIFIVILAVVKPF
jgi:putative membrane protein